MAPSTGPIRLKAFSRTKSEVGLVAVPFGASIRRPFSSPAMTLTDMSLIGVPVDRLLHFCGGT